MSTLLETAQTAIAEGNTREAHVHLAKLLKKEPKNSEAWYLLSSVVPTADQRKIFLNKVLKIEPTHVGALSDLATLDNKVVAPEIALPISHATEDLDAQARGESVPSWMADSTSLPESQSLEKVVEMADTMVEVPALPEEPIPDWLKAEPADAWIDTPDENATIVAPPPKPPTPKATPKPKPVAAPLPKTSDANNSPVLMILIIIALLVAFFLIWTVLGYFGVF